MKKNNYFLLVLGVVLSLLVGCASSAPMSVSKTAVSDEWQKELDKEAKEEKHKKGSCTVTLPLGDAGNELPPHRIGSFLLFAKRDDVEHLVIVRRPNEERNFIRVDHRWKGKDISPGNGPDLVATECAPYLNALSIRIKQVIDGLYGVKADP